MKRLFTQKFISTLKKLIELHHCIYPQIPPRDIFFESLVKEAFKKSGWPEAKVVGTKPNSPQHDLLVGKTRLSIKTETGKGTRAGQISITKLCTTETGSWDSI